MSLNRKTIAAAGLLAGLAAVTALVAWQGVGAVGATLATAGWRIVFLAAYYLPHFVLFAAAWRLLFLPGRAPTMAESLYTLWIGTAVNTLLPVASIGGELVKIRILVLKGYSGTDLGASLVVDKTVRAFTLVLWAMIGVGVLFALSADSQLIAAAAGGISLMAAGIGGFVLVQRMGMFGGAARAVARLAGNRDLAGLVGSAAALDETIRAIYRHHGRFALSCLLRLSARVILAGEVWLAAYLMGHPVTIWEAVMLRSLAAALRGAAFAVPGGIGVQEGGYMVLGALLGHPPDLMLAVSLATRVRELIVGIPGLIAWQHAEGRNLFRRRRHAAGATLAAPGSPEQSKSAASSGEAPLS